KKSVAESKSRLRVIRRRKKRRAANVAERSFRGQVRRNRSRIFDPRIALMIEKLNAEAGINRGLIGIVGRPGDLIQAEARKQRSLVGNAMVHADRELIRARGHFGRSRIGPRAV